jgi:hypothetical protein
MWCVILERDGWLVGASSRLYTLLGVVIPQSRPLIRNPMIPAEDPIGNCY